MADRYIGVEIGASKVQAALGYGDGSLISVSQHRVVLEDGARGILNWLCNEIPEIIAGGRVAAIGVGFGGILESSTGVSLVSVQVDGWENFPVKGWFEKTFGLPVVVLNDTVAGGCGEYVWSQEKPDVFFYTNIGSGIGGCLLLNGRYFDGSGYGGAYFGHTYVPDWTAGKAGAYTKVETLCSGFGIERRLNNPGYVPESSLLYKLGEQDISLCREKQGKGPADRPGYTCAMLGEAARQQDTFALEEIERTADSYALGLSNVITLFGAETVVIGGGVAKLGNVLFDPIRRQTEKYVFISAANRYTIRQSVLMDNAVLAGSIAAAAKNVGSF
ncbi:MAG: ROK family protein [Treponema sp.]|jgi:glucokinase|nr:ROK family protein [Treponema sp.]